MVYMEMELRLERGKVTCVCWVPAKHQLLQPECWV